MSVTEREERLREKLAAEPGERHALRELAALVGRGRDRKNEAVELWARYVKAVEPGESGEALLQLARAQVEARQEAAAIDTLERCTLETPELFAAFELLGELLRRAGRLEEATSALRRASELNPEAVQPRLALATCLDALGRSREADDVLRTARTLKASDPAVVALVQELMQRRG